MGELPTGTVTLLFTDIEGSTRLLQDLGRERYVRALSDQRRLVRAAFTRNGGVEVEMQGDSFFFAFGHAQEAVSAAGDAQQELAAHEWETEPIRIRIGIHTGEPIPHEGLYAGLDVHRAARIMSAGHGGQTLLSRSTRDALDTGFDLRDLGQHRLKDLAEAEWLFQLGYEDFPPLKSLSNTNLPAEARSLIGRERELVELSELLAREEVRLVTLTGPGGTGKTRLALRLAAELVEEYRNGVFFVSLAPISDPALVIPTIAQTLGVKERPGESLSAALGSDLADKLLLLVLDNFEHVVEAATDVGQLVAASPQLRLLVTSREPLHLGGEHEYLVPPLTEPEAVALFTERAQEVCREFELDGDRHFVELICARLDRLPLAIELAAARVRVLPPGKLLERLEQRLPLLASRRRDLPARQRTLEAAIAWSRDLLTEQEQRLFARLAVFVGGWTLEAAEEICEADVEILESLLTKSLIRQQEGPDAQPRFLMLETIREFASGELEASREGERMRRRHAEFFSQLAERAVDRLGTLEQPNWLRRLEAERDNLRASLQWSLDAREHETGLLLAHAFGNLCRFRGPISEGRSWLEVALAGAGEQTALARSKAFHEAAVLAWVQDDLESAQAFAEESLALAKSSEDAERAGRALLTLGFVAGAARDYDRCEEVLEEAIAVYSECGNEHEATMTLHMLGYFARARGDYPRALALVEDAIARSRRAGDTVGIALGTGNLGGVLREEGRIQEALPLLRVSLLSAHELSHSPWVLSGLYDIAAAMASRQDHEAAAVILGGAEAFRESIGSGIGHEPAEHEIHEATVSMLRRELDADLLNRAWAEGRGLTHDQLVVTAVEWIDSAVLQLESELERSLG
jgi:predicted ATPase/class 3 adenylate cyclase